VILFPKQRSNRSIVTDTKRRVMNR